MECGGKMIRYSNKGSKKPTDFNISKVGLYKIYGSNGSGKSVFVNALYKQNLKTIGLLPQDVCLLERLSVNDNLIAFDCLQYVENSEFDYLLPTDLKVPVQKLSGGEKRKIQLYIILNCKKDFLVLDEPFNHIDKRTVQKLKTDIERLAKNKVILFVDHSDILQATNSVDIAEISNYHVDGDLNLKFENKLTFKLAHIINNLGIVSKLFMVIAGIGLLIFIFSVASLNKLSSDTNDFTNLTIEKEVMTNICTGVDAASGPRTDSRLVPDDGGIKATLSFFERFPLSRNYVDNHKNYQFEAIELENPKVELEAYDGQLPVYDIGRLISGSYPDDYSNQVIIPYFYARYLTQDNDQKPDDIIGTEIEINNQKVVVSGIFRGIHQIRGNVIISSYQGTGEDCNPLLNSVQPQSNLKKLLVILLATGFGVLAYIIALYALEYNFFRMMKVYNITNKLNYLIFGIALGLALISIVYYFNYY